MHHAPHFDCRAPARSASNRMTVLRLSDFLAGTVYDVGAGDAVLPLTLAKAQALSDSGREGGSFRLEFLGPDEPILPQAIYRFASGEAEHEIFIVPIARGDGGVRYEAVFY
jgi:hypothetical protein